MKVIYASIVSRSSQFLNIRTLTGRARLQRGSLEYEYPDKEIGNYCLNRSIPNLLFLYTVEGFQCSRIVAWFDVYRGYKNDLSLRVNIGYLNRVGNSVFQIYLAVYRYSCDPSAMNELVEVSHSSSKNWTLIVYLYNENKKLIESVVRST